MTVYDWNEDATLPPAIVRDATGKIWRRVLFVDTVTGFMVRCDKHLDEVKGHVPAPVSVTLLTPDHMKHAEIARRLLDADDRS